MIMTKKPAWIRIKGVDVNILNRMKVFLDQYHLHTVCESAMCPNIGTCFRESTATFMLLGNICTRNCAFCGVLHGKPFLTPDPDEPTNVARAARELNLKHVVITSVTRDDLQDGGARQFAETIKEVNRLLPGATTDVLIPDLKGSRDHLAVVIEAKPDILAHNIETVPRLYKKCRPQADYGTSVKVLENTKKIYPQIFTKSGMMLGLGETREEVLEVMNDLSRVKCDFITLGQYLRPTRENLEVKKYISPEVFEEYKKIGKEMGFSSVASAPFVRSSFHAGEALRASLQHRSNSEPRSRYDDLPDRHS